METRLAIILTLGVTGCAGSDPQPAPVEAPAEVPRPVEMTVGPPRLEPDPLALACEALLDRLAETEPLLAEIDASLEAQAERFDAAIAGLAQPPPEPRAMVCPPSRDGPIVGKEVIGALEWLYMDPPGRHFRARIDTGAETSSLSASELVEFERDGEDWVRFMFQHDGADESVEFELPIKRTVLIRYISSDDPVRRHVVELDIRLGEQPQTTEFTLTDRSNMTYPIMLGRSFLMDLYVVDVSRSYTQERYNGT